MNDLNPRIEKIKSENGKEYDMSVSIGFQSVPITKGFKLDQLIEKADREMYKMKSREDI